MIRVAVSLLSVLMCGSAFAETVEIPIVVGEAPALGDSLSFWNRLQKSVVPGLTSVEVCPVLVLLPPDVSGIPALALEREDCSLSPEPGGKSESRLISMADGAALPFTTRLKGAEELVAGPVTMEGDVNLLPVLLFPGRLHPETGERELCKRLHLSVTFERTGEPTPEQGHFSARRFARHVVNPGHFDQWYVEYKRDSPAFDYLVVTRQQFAESSTQLPLFVEFKKARGFNPLVVTLEQIEEDMAPLGLDRPEALRGWLKKSYKGLGFQYLLIIGAPGPDDEGGVPMKRCYPSKEFESPDWGLYDVPTDLYYADLTGNWNPDDDEFWCELEDYMELPEDWPPEPEPEADRLDGVDLTPELLVGRVPHYGKLPFYADGILKRTMEYAKMEPSSWHNRVLLPSPMVTFPDGGWVDSSLVSQFLVDESLVKNAIFHTMLSECEGNLTSEVQGHDCLTETTFPAYWNQGYSAVLWCAHGSQEVAVRDIWYTDLNGDKLPQQGETEEPAFVNNLFHKAASPDYPAVVFQGSCLNADPEVSGNLAHSLLQHVSMANVASSRLTMGMDPGDNFWEPSPYSPGAFTLGVYFIHAAVSRRQPMAEAFHYAQGTLIFGVQPWTLKVRMEFNLYGDPAMRIPGCDGNDDCDDENPCNGLEFCENGKCVVGEPVLCTPDKELDPCEEYSCQPEGVCAYTIKPNHASCDDGDPCTGPEYCWEGECVVEPLVCPPAESVCWTSFCDPDKGGCVFEPAVDGLACLSGTKQGICADGKCIVEETPLLFPEPGLEADAVGSPDVVEAGPGRVGKSGCSAGASPVSGTAWSLVILLLLLAIPYFVLADPWRIRVSS